MLFAVLETAIRDYEYLESVADRGKFSAAQSKRMRSMVEDNHPREFFDGTWFMEICDLLGLNHHAVKAIVEERVKGDRGNKRPLIVDVGVAGGEMPFV